jgi:hypothetical protein
MPPRLNDKYLIRAIEGEPENVVGGIMIPFTTPVERDRVFNDYFDKETDLALNLLGADIPRPVNFHHNKQRIVDIGFTRALELRDDGLYAVTELDKDNPAYAWIMDDLKAGKLGYSAETTPGYYVRNNSGHVDRFLPFAVAISHSPTAPNGKTKVGLLRAYSFDEELFGLSAESADDDEVFTVVRSIWNYAIDEPEQKPKSGYIPYSQTNPRHMSAQLPSPHARAHIPLAGNIGDMQAPVDQVDLLDALGWYHFNACARAHSHLDMRYPNDDREGFLKGLASRVLKEFEEDEQKKKSTFLQRQFYVDPRTKKIVETPSAWDVLTRFLPKQYSSAGLARADEIIRTDLTGFGEEFMYTAHKLMILREIRTMSRVFGLFPAFIMESETYEWPKLAEPTYARRVPQTADKSSMGAANSPYAIETPGTSNITFSIVDKFGKIFDWTDEYRHWNKLNYVSAYQQLMVDTLWRTADRILLHGDETDTNANISYDGGGAGDGPTTDGVDWLILVDGLIYHCLVGNGSSTDNANAAVAATDFMAGRRGIGSIAIAPDDLVHIVTEKVAFDAAELTEVETVEAFGLGASILTGQAASLYGVPLVYSEDMSLTDGSGHISQTGGNNTQGSILTVHRRASQIGIMWNMEIKMVQDDYSDTSGIKGRMAFDWRPLQDNCADFQFDFA